MIMERIIIGIINYACRYDSIIKMWATLQQLRFHWAITIL
jgi:hypothetical protein